MSSSCNLRKWIKLLPILAYAFVPVAGTYETEPVRSDNIEAKLISEVVAIQPGQPFWVGLRLKHDPEWHTYWKNPGDSGLETTINWNLPDDFSAGEIQWPYPEKIRLGPLVSYGFEREVMLLVEITPPDDLEVNQSVSLTARVDWLECKVECVTGSADFTVDLPVTDSAPGLNHERAELFAAARAELPLVNTEWAVRGFSTETGYQLQAIPPSWLEHEIDEAEFFILDSELIEYGIEQNWRRADEGYLLDLTRNRHFSHLADSLRGVLVAESGWRGPGSEKALLVDSVPVTAVGQAGISVVEQVGPGSRLSSLAVALIFAFLGGVMLNLMPCVFPVISMKIMGFVQQAEAENAQIFKHGLLFAGGIVVSFWGLAGLLILLRAGGEQLGWGFHLQSPAFLLAMSVLFFLLALNLFGVFEVGTSWMGLGRKASASAGWKGSFFSGVLATLIATPCTAPFMGAALGYALTLSPVQALLIFSFLGLGMAAPYVMLSAFPQWLSRIPKPGPWMESFKQAVGWIFILVVVHMAHVLFVMAEGYAVVLLLYVLCAVGIGAWILGRWGAISRRYPVRLAGRVIASVLLLVSIGGGLLAASQLRTPSPGENRDTIATNGIPWENFSPERLAELRTQGKPVFINFTAAWCLSCKVNERVALSSNRVQAAFRDQGVVPLKADWTNRDAVIGATLEQYGRSSVPFYVLYGTEPESDPYILPVVLTPGTVLDALDKLE